MYGGKITSSILVEVEICSTKLKYKFLLNASVLALTLTGIRYFLYLLAVKEITNIREDE